MTISSEFFAMHRMINPATMNIPAVGPTDQARMIALIARMRNSADRNAGASLGAAAGSPHKGGNISVIATTSGRMRQIQGTVVELDPRTAVSTGSLIVEDTNTGELVQLPAPVVMEG
jgi:hypothetical protein